MPYYNMPLDDDKTMFLEDLEQRGVLTRLYRMNIISPKPFMLLQARLKIKSLMNQGLSKAAACKRIARVMGVHEKTVYTYIR